MNFINNMDKIVEFINYILGIVNVIQDTVEIGYNIKDTDKFVNGIQDIY